MDNKLKRNIVYNAITQLIIVLIPLITAPYIARKLDVELIGNYNYCFSIVSFFGLFANLGISVTGISLVGKAKNDKKALSKLFFELMGLRFIFTLVTLFAYVFFVIITREFYYYFMIFSLLIISTFLDITWLFQGLEEFKIVFIRTILVRLILLVLTFVLVKSKESIYIYVWINVLSTLIPNILLFPYLKKIICKVPINEVKPFRNFDTIIKFFLPGVVYSTYSLIDKAMIKIITGGTIEVGYYEQAYKIAFIGVTIISVISTVFSSRISGLTEEEEIKKMHKLSWNMTMFISLLAFVGFFILSDFFIPFYYGDGYEGSIIILKVFSILPLIMGISHFVSYQFFLPKLITKPSIIAISGAIILNICLNIVLIKHYGGLGAALATIISETYISVFYLICYNKYNKIIVLIKSSWKIFIGTTLVFVFILILSYFYRCKSLMDFFVYIVLICSSYLFVLILLREETLVSILKKLFRRK